MAIGKNIKGITIEFNGDTTKLGKAIADVDKKTKGLDKELKEVNRALKFNPGNADLLAQKQQILAQKVDQSKDRLNALKEAQKQLDDDPSVDKTSEDYRGLQREIIETESKLKHFESELKKLSHVNLTALGTQLKRTGDKMQTIGKKASRYVTAPIAVGFGAAVKTTLDFDAAMSQVAATMGVTNDDLNKINVTSGEFTGTLRELAVEMGSKTAFTATEAAEALNYMALAGYDAQTSADMLPSVLNLAAAGNMELAKASDMVTDSQTALGLTTKQTEILIDQMAKTSSKSNTSVEQLGEAILTVGGTAKMMKGGTEELNAVLGVLADNGIKGAEGGTILRNTLLSLGSPTDKAAEKLAELGVSVYDTEGNMKDLRQLMPELAGALDNLTGEERTQALAAIFTKRDLKGVNALLATSTTRWDELSTAIDDSGGAAQKMADTQLDNLKGSLTILKSALEGLAINVGDVLTPFLKTLAEWVTSLTDKFNGLSPQTQKVIVAIAGIAAAIGPLLVVGGVLLSSIGRFLIWIPKLIGGFTSVMGAFSKLTSVLMGNPWMLVAAAAIAAIVLIVKNWDKIKEFFANLWEGIKNVAGAAWKAIKDTVVGLVVGIKDGIASAFTAIGNFIKTIATAWFNWITWPYRKAWEVIKKIATKIKDVFNFDFKLPKIKLPHFSIKPKGWQVGDLLKGSIPTLGIDWYAKGGIFRSPSVIGVGEKGPEAVLPIEKLQEMLGAMADSIVSGMSTAMLMQSAATGGEGREIVIPIYLYPSGPKMGEETVKTYDKWKRILG